MVQNIFVWLLFFVLFACGNQPTRPNSADSDLNARPKLSSDAYYVTRVGHEVEHLEKVYKSLKEQGCEHFIFYAGDSSLDNKLWFSDTATAVNGYENILEPPRMKKDVDYWVNKLIVEGRGPKNQRVCSIMTSLEGSKLSDRDEQLLPQDIFVRDHISPDDYLIVSVGGNDIALGPSEETRKAISTLQDNPQDQVAFDYIGNIVGLKTESFIARLTERKRPKKIIVSMIYFPDEHSKNNDSWAQATFDAFKYNTDPSKLQNLIKALYTQHTQKIAINGTITLPVALYEVLNGKDTRDYVQGIEPSPQGGRKLAEFFLKTLSRAL